ncbi:MAG: Single-stranded DNA binding protein [Thermoplasmata archaeon]
MDKEEYNKIVDELVSTIGDKASRDKIEKELNSWLQFPGINIKDIMKKIVEKFNPGKELDTFVKIKDIESGEHSVSVVAKVLSINKKELENKGNMYYGILADETGSIPFTAWKLNIEVAKGDVIKIVNGYTKEWRDNVKVVIGNYTTVSMMPRDLIKNVQAKLSKFKIIDLKPQPGRVEIVGKILSSSAKNVIVDDKNRTLYSGIIADETGSIGFSAWDTEIKNNATARIKGAYVKEFRNMPNLVIDKNSIVQYEDVDIKVKRSVVSIENIEERGGPDLKIEGIILEIKEAGVIARCDKCKKVLVNGLCPEHGKVGVYLDLRIKAVVDDGTGALMAIFNKEVSEKFLSSNFEELKKREAENIGSSMILHEVEDRFLFRPIYLLGSIMTSENGLTMFVKDFSTVDYTKIDEEAEKMLENLRW